MSQARHTERDTPVVAGMYDYYLGGTANSEADRAAVEEIRKTCPEIIDAAWANRGFLQRSVKRMAAEWGVRQFIDIGAGLPTQRNTHEVVAEVTAGGRVVYVDSDEEVIARGHDLLAGVDGTAAVHADIRDPKGILGHPDTLRLIDLDEPVGLLLVAVTQFVPDADDPWAVVASYVDAVAPGSYLALSAPTSDFQAPRIVDSVVKVYAATPTPAKARSREEIRRFFDGLELVPPYEGGEPGLTYAGLWGAEDVEAADSDGSRWFYAAVARKP
ncbi:SAM-dependent methyltransferase [Sphaerisporangium fuscum]|uniref:SAM-dependent methyltransferase n=1 Tax=Sphaerisporangium fuscum TaxID=2835868 RepID=UPI001BDC0308|nr:SAM-dependent methyltransferase [Sphaerisporangium fuscum]